MADSLWCVQSKSDKTDNWNIWIAYGFYYSRQVIIDNYNRARKDFSYPYNRTWQQMRKAGLVRAVKCKVVIIDE